MLKIEHKARFQNFTCHFPSHRKHRLGLKRVNSRSTAKWEKEIQKYNITSLIVPSGYLINDFSAR